MRHLSQSFTSRLEQGQEQGCRLDKLALPRVAQNKVFHCMVECHAMNRMTCMLSLPHAIQSDMDRSGIAAIKQCLIDCHSMSEARIRAYRPNDCTTDSNKSQGSMRWRTLTFEIAWSSPLSRWRSQWTSVCSLPQHNNQCQLQLHTSCNWMIVSVLADLKCAWIQYNAWQVACWYVCSIPSIVIISAR